MKIDRLVTAMTAENVETLARALCVEAGVDPDARRSLTLPTPINAPEAPPTVWDEGPEWHYRRGEAKKLIAVAVGAADATEARLAAGELVTG